MSEISDLIGYISKAQQQTTEYYDRNYNREYISNTITALRYAKIEDHLRQAKILIEAQEFIRLEK